MSSPTPPVPPVAHHGVPGEVVQQVHDANARLHAAHRRMEEAIAEPGFEGNRLEQATRELHEAQEQIDAADDRATGAIEQAAPGHESARPPATARRA